MGVGTASCPDTGLSTRDLQLSILSFACNKGYIANMLEYVAYEYVSRVTRDESWYLAI